MRYVCAREGIRKWDGVRCKYVPFFTANATACSLESKEMVMLERGSPLQGEEGGVEGRGEERGGRDGEDRMK